MVDSRTYSIHDRPMAAKTKPRSKQTGSVNLHITLPAELVAALDHCVAEQTRADVWPKPTRTDLIRNALTEAVKSWKK